MKKFYILFLVLFINSLPSLSQIKFAYDGAGNRISRINQGSSNNCSFAVSINGVGSVIAGSAVTLQGSCTGADCNGVNYSWSGNGISGSGAAISFTAPNTNGSYAYTLTASKAGCANQTANIALNVTGCCGTGSGGVVLTAVRAYFRTDNCGVCQDRCANSYVQGSADNANWTTLSTFPRPNPGWNNYPVGGTTAYRYLRYVAADGCFGEVNEVEFYAGSTKLSGQPIGGGSPANGDASLAYQSALDGNLGTFWHGSSTGSQNFAGLDLGTTPGGPACNFTPGISANVSNPTCGQAVTLQGTCSGSDCGGVSYAWSGNGSSGSGSSVNLNVPGSNGSYTYTVTASKAECSNQTGSVTLNVSGCGGGTGGGLATNACYTIKSEKTGKRLQAMGNNTIEQQPANGATSQLWKLDDRGNNRRSFTVQDGTGRAIQTTNGGNNGGGIALSTYTANGQYDWSLQASPADANLWRVVYPANNSTWDLQNSGNDPLLQIWGNTTEGFVDYRAFRFEATSCTAGGTPACAFTPTVTATTTNPTCNQAVTLNANCSGGDCGGVSYSWSGNGIGGSGSSVSFNVPGTNGSYTYTVTASKTGCSNQTGTVTLNVSGCGGGTGGGLATNACYTIKSEKTGKRLQAMGNNTIEQQTANGATGQLWKLDDRGNNRRSLTVQDGTGRAIQTTNGGNNGGGIALGAYTANGQYDWSLQASPADANLWRVVYPANNSTWDLQNSGNDPLLQIWGNTTEGFVDYRAFRFEAASCTTGGGSCAFAPTVTATTTSPACNQAVTLNANCSGGDCGGVSYAWSGNGLSGGGASVNLNVPGANGSYTYTVTASKAGCNNQTGSVTLNVNGCGGGGSHVLTSVRVYFRTDNCGVCQDRCANSYVQGSADNANWTTLTTFPRPNPGWNNYPVGGTTAYRYLRYVAADGCFGEVNEVEFYAGSTKLSGVPIGGGTPANGDPGLVYQSALDGNLGTFWHGSSTGSQNFAGLDLGNGVGAIGGRRASGKPAPMAEPEAVGLHLLVSPNPNGGQFVVSFQTRAGQVATLRLFEVGGRAVRAAQTIAGTGQVHQQAISLPGQVRGLVLVEVSSGNQRETRKVVIE